MEKNTKKIKLAHGSGQGLDELLHEVILPALYPSPQTPPLEDAFVITSDQLFNNSPHGFSKPVKLAFTTDSFVVQPLEFPGGNIGTLAACGTINDLAMMGASPRLLSVSLIIEEGLETELLRRLLHSLQAICAKTSMTICCGDTKVVDKGKADGLFITTSGLGLIPSGREISVTKARPGDWVIVSGPLGLHGIAILAARKSLNFASEAVSDCAPLNGLVEALLDVVPDTRVLRDCTRGGCAAVLNEIASASGVSIVLEQDRLPVPDVVKGACSFLGMDPLHIACEGRFAAIIPGSIPGIEQKAIQVLNNHPLGKGAAIIGRVTEKEKFPVIMETPVGGTRLVDVPPGELLPRIC
jgi:hydrogenase expression/formation protein HypE